MKRFYRFSPTRYGKRPTYREGVFAGLVGGIAELAWIELYCAAAGSNASAVARAVVDTVLPNGGNSTIGVPLGITVHLILAVGIGIGLAGVCRWPSGTFVTPVVILSRALALLALVWVVNFVVILPHLNPAFLTVVRPGVALLSKLMFALSAAAVLTRAARFPIRDRGECEEVMS